MKTLANLEQMLDDVEQNDSWVTGIAFDADTPVSREVEDLESQIIAGLANNTQVTSVRLGGLSVQVASIVKMLAENKSVTRFVIAGDVMTDWRYLEAILKALSDNETVTEFELQVSALRDAEFSNETLREEVAVALRLLLANNTTITHITLNSFDIGGQAIFEREDTMAQLVSGLKKNKSLTHLTVQAQEYHYMPDYNLAMLETALDQNKTLRHLALPYNHTVESSSNIAKRISAGLWLNANQAERDQMMAGFAAGWKAKKECCTRVTQTISTLFADTTTYVTEQVKSYLPRNR